MCDCPINVTEKIDIIEKEVYKLLKPCGFRKFGRTLHRFVSGDISQVINFQSGMPANIYYGSFCVNLGIRIPECDERCFNSTEETKKYYPEYKCTLRSRLGIVKGEKETWYDLSENTDLITANVIKEINDIVIPAFNALDSREAILAHRKDYPLLDDLEYRLILLDECMIYGHLGNTEKAKECFEQYYQSVVDEYNDIKTNGRKIYLKKGEHIISGKEHIIADKDGYYTLYAANHSHIEYLDELAVKLSLR